MISNIPVSDPADQNPGKAIPKAKTLFYRLYDRDSVSAVEDFRAEFPGGFQFIYLDPPYNTRRSRGSRKSYKDNREGWDGLIRPVLQNACQLLNETGFLAISINQMELFNLRAIADEVFGSDCFIGLFPVKIRHKERQLMINATFHDLYEYLIIYRKQKKTRFFTEHKAARMEKFCYDIHPLTHSPEILQISDKKIEVYRPGEFRIEKTRSSEQHFRRYIIAGKLATANWSGEFFENHLRALGEDLLIRVYGLEKEGLGYRWFHTQDRGRNSGVYFQSTLTAGRPVLPTNDLDFTEIVPNIYKEGGPGCDFKDSKKPEALLRFLIEICSRPGDLVGDFFAGSGTTLAVAVKMGRSCIACDDNPDSLDIIRKRMSNLQNGLDHEGIAYKFELREVAD